MTRHGSHGEAEKDGRTGGRKDEARENEAGLDEGWHLAQTRRAR